MQRIRPVIFAIWLPLAAGLPLGAAYGQDIAGDIRVGIIGLDTSHSTAFTRTINDPEDPDMAGLRVVAAYPYGSTTIASSYERIPQYSEDVQAMGVEVVASIAELLERVDAVLLLTNDGHPHLEQARQVIRAGKPLFVDKPVAGSLDDAVRIFDEAARAGVPVFSASSLRYMAAAQAVAGGSMGAVVGADTYSPAVLEPGHPDLFWYGIHAVETLFTVMGPDCRTVRRIRTDGTDFVVGVWADGRVGTVRGIRAGRHDYGGTAFGTEGVAPLGPFEGYRPLLVEIVAFFRTGVAPVAPDETLAIYAFMEAADESKRRGGTPVDVAAVLDAAVARARGR